MRKLWLVVNLGVNNTVYLSPFNVLGGGYRRWTALKVCSLFVDTYV
jgi:hypothetical protein